MRRLALAALTLLAAAGCGPPCAVCSFDVQGRICDGSGYVACDDTNRGRTFSCVTTARVAVCTPSGWALDNAPIKPDAGP